MPVPLLTLIRVQFKLLWQSLSRCFREKHSDSLWADWSRGLIIGNTCTNPTFSSAKRSTCQRIWFCMAVMQVTCSLFRLNVGNKRFSFNNSKCTLSWTLTSRASTSSSSCLLFTSRSEIWLFRVLFSVDRYLFLALEASSFFFTSSCSFRRAS